MSKSFPIAIVSLLLLGLMVVFLISIGGEPRMADGQLEFSEASTLEIAFIFTTVSFVVVAWILGMANAVKNHQGWWVAGIFIIWPLTYIYLFFVLRRGVRN